MSKTAEALIVSAQEAVQKKLTAFVAFARNKGLSEAGFDLQDELNRALSGESMDGERVQRLVTSLGVLITYAVSQGISQKDLVTPLYTNSRGPHYAMVVRAWAPKSTSSSGAQLPVERLEFVCAANSFADALEQFKRAHPEVKGKADVDYDPTEGSSLGFVVYSANEAATSQPPRGFWSEELEKWVSISEATVYAKADFGHIDPSNLPALGRDGCWTAHAQALMAND